MTTPIEPTGLAYLWDPTQPADRVVVQFERPLSMLRLDPADTPLSLPPQAKAPARRPSRRAWWLAVAASLVLLAGATAAYRWTWPEGAAWPMTLDSSDGSRAARLAVGDELRLPATDTAHVRLARIGSMDVRSGTVISLRATTSNRHRLALTLGGVSVRTWAPPGAVIIQTPAGDVVDLGCVFRLDVTTERVARLTVDSGWVQLDNVYGEMLVPAGASSEMAPGGGPLVPVFDDATVAFRDGARRAERAIAAGAASSIDLGFAAGARRKDVITLLLLARNGSPDVGLPLLERAAELEAPPAGVTVEAVAKGDAVQFWRWYDSLDLPPPKNWWRNWRDALGWGR
jgi:hypothetical protein